MAQPLATHQVGYATPGDAMELEPDIDGGHGLIDEADLDIDIEITTDTADVQDNDYIFEDAVSDANLQPSWPVDQDSDELMQAEDRDAQSMVDDATIQDIDLEDEDLTQDLNDGVRLTAASTGTPAMTDVAAEGLHDLDLQPSTETFHDSAVNQPAAFGGLNLLQSQVVMDSKEGPALETDLTDQEQYTTKDDAEPTLMDSRTAHELKPSVEDDPVIEIISSFEGGDHGDAIKSSNSDEATDQVGGELGALPSEPGVPPHPVRLFYEETDMSLFPPTSDTETETYFLHDESLMHSSISDLFKAMRSVLADTVDEDDELELVMDSLGLCLSEDSIHTLSMTLSELLKLYLQLSRQDGVDTPEPFFLTLTTKAGFGKKLKELSAAAEAGKGISQLSLWDDDRPNTADGEPSLDDDEVAAVEHSYGDKNSPTDDHSNEHQDEQQDEYPSNHQPTEPTDALAAIPDGPDKNESDDDSAAASNVIPNMKQDTETLEPSLSPTSTSGQGVPLRSPLAQTSTDDYHHEVEDEHVPTQKTSKASDVAEEDLINYDEEDEDEASIELHGDSKADTSITATTAHSQSAMVRSVTTGNIPKAPSEGSATEEGDLIDYDDPSDDAYGASNQDLPYTDSPAEERPSPSSTTKRSRIDNGEKDLERDDGQGPKRVRSG